MLFNSVNFIVFFILVTTVYYLLPHKYRWILLLISSYVFYMAWKPIFILLIILCTLVNYIGALNIKKSRTQASKKFWLVISLTISFGVLFFYKYLPFINESLITILNYTKVSHPFRPIDILLPMGISFYTFQTLSYTIDVYRGTIPAEKNFFLLSLYVVFFPQLVAGPIERSDRLLPQLRKKVNFDIDMIVDGFKIMLIGFFKKVVVADRLSVAVNTIYNSPNNYSGLYYVIATIFFAFQIYCDFCGYSEIAIGTAKILGFDLMKNFDRPYFSKSIQEFWRRWHISLSTWFKDYLYIPLGGNRVSRPRYYFNVFITFLVSGLWHGANWTFAIWGILHGLYQIVGNITKNFRDSIKKSLHLEKSIILTIFQTLCTFILVCFAWIFFRANTVTDAGHIISNLFTDIHQWTSLRYIYDTVTNMGLSLFEFIVAVSSLILLVLGEMISIIKQKNNVVTKQNFVLEGFFYLSLLLIIITMGVFFNASQFIYFQF